MLDEESMVEPFEAESDQFSGQDFSSLSHDNRRGVAPSLVASKEKWMSMFKRNTNLHIWTVLFRAARRISGQTQMLPEGFPTLEMFFDHCPNIDVFSWAFGVYTQYVDRCRNLGAYDYGEFTQLELFLAHVVRQARRHLVAIVEVPNPKWMDPAKPSKPKAPKLNMFAPKPPRLTPEERKKKAQEQLAEEEQRRNEPQFLKQRFSMKQSQFEIIAHLAKRGFFSNATGESTHRHHTSWPRIIQSAVEDVAAAGTEAAAAAGTEAAAAAGTEAAAAAGTEAAAAAGTEAAAAAGTEAEAHCSPSAKRQRVASQTLALSPSLDPSWRV
jgi:hypothetical protein